MKLNKHPYQDLESLKAWNILDFVFGLWSFRRTTDRRAHYARNVTVPANKSVKATDIKLTKPRKPNNLP